MRWLVTLVLVLALLFLWYGLRDAPSVDAPGSAAEAPHVTPDLTDAPGHSSGLDGSVLSPGKITRIAAGLPMKTFEGSFIVRFLDGPPVHDASGSFVLVASIDGKMFEETIQVRGGCFQATVPVGAKMNAKGYPRLNGMIARLRRWELLPNANGRLKIRAFWYPLTQLHVRDAATGMALSGVTVLPRKLSRRGLAVFPSLDSETIPLVENASSPIAIPGEGTMRTCWVIAKGYAWKLDKLTPHDNEVTVLLERAGGLTVQLTEYDPAWNAYVQLERLEEPMTSSRGALPVGQEGVTRFDGLEPGRYVIRVGQYEWNQPPLLGEAEATVSVGNQTRVTIRIERPIPESALVKLGGTVRSWPGEFYRDLSVNLAPVSDDLRRQQPKRRLHKSRMVRITEDPLVFQFYFGRALPGDYHLTLFPVSHQIISVEPGRRNILRLETPPLHPVTIRLKHGGERGLPHPDPLSISWRSGTGDSSHQMHLARDQNLQEYSTQLPTGFVTVGLPGIEWIWAEGAERAIRPGKNLLEFYVQKRCAFRVSLISAGVSVGFERAWLRGVRAHSVLDSEVRTPWLTDGQEGRSIYFDGTGPHRLVFPSLDGYEAIEPIEVFLNPGETRDLAVPVVALPAPNNDTR